MENNIFNVNDVDFIGFLDNVDKCRGNVYLENGNDIYRLNGVLSDMLLKVKYLNKELGDAIIIFNNSEDLNIIEKFVYKN